MSRSVKKGPFVQESSEKKRDADKAGDDKKVVKTRSWSYTILADCVVHTVAGDNGRKHVPVCVTEDMGGHKLGEFAPTRKFKGHAGEERKTSLR